MLNKILTIIVILLCPVGLWAACAGSSPTWTAADTTKEEIEACITAATAGDTINVPTGSSTWSVPLTIDKRVILVGAGNENTVITMSVDDLIRITAIDDWRITAMGFVCPDISKYLIRIYGGTGWRIDHCRFTNNSGQSRESIHAHSVSGTANSSPEGLIDNNVFINGRIGLGLWDASTNAVWAAPLGLGDANTIYIEDNTFTRPDNLQGKNAVDSNYGASYVFRYNYVEGEYISNHGTSKLGLGEAHSRAARRWEIYGNTVEETHDMNTGPFYVGGGSGVIFYNSVVGSTWNNKGPEISTPRAKDASYPTADNVSTNGACDGDNAYDGNTAGQSGYPCRDQVGYGQDSSLLTFESPPYPSQTLIPAYFYQNIYSGAHRTATVYDGSSPTWVQANREYYDYTATFNGSVGVGCGTFANRPGTCTIGVGYWATDQSCSTLTDYVGASPTTPISGTLYKCTATNTWTAYYVPYTYPHPLRGEGEADTTAPTITDFVIPSTSSSLIVNITTFTATDAVGVTGYCAVETDSSAGCSWVGSAPATYTFASEGAKTLYAFAKDAAGNVSSSSNDGVTITLPTGPTAIGKSLIGKSVVIK